MECELMPKRSWFDSHPRRIPLAVICAASLLQVCVAQTAKDAETVKSILRVSEAEQVEFVKSVLEQHFPENEGDRFSLLLVNRSALVVPLIESKIETELGSASRSERFIELASAMIAYAGDEHSVRAISKLIRIDERRFGTFIGRTLDNAGKWRNPFGVAYQALDLGDGTVAGYTTMWAEAALTSDRMQRVWAEAMLDRYGKVVPSETEWAQDPIASRLKDRASPELRQSVVRFAAEAQSKREKM
jgi:hypothetical protein